MDYACHHQPHTGDPALITCVNMDFRVIKV